MQFRSFFLLAVAIPLTAGAEPPRAPEESGAPLTVATIGTALFLGSYGLSIGVGSQSLDRDNRGLYVPVVGPWIALGAQGGDCPVTNPECDGDTRTKVLLAIDGVAQATGALMIISGAVQHRRERERRSVRIAPVFTRGNPGVAVVGRF